ncbi:ParB/RepB/Spo0J family partition protein [Streptomyces sp. 8N114]|uniref:ParB/RepB/Spo0J family partition protein n=1 Tax=Streptomyces sp. 8N114 TaxID=3457419 RepID=UPI003FD06045
MTSHQKAADRVGPPAFVGPRSSRGRAITAATGDPVSPPQAAPTATVPTDEVSFNPDNPREELGDVSDLVASFNEVGQIVAITIATAEAYLASRPDRKHDLDAGAKYVVVDGNRRLKAAREAGTATIKIMFGDEFASTDQSLLEAAFIANAKRKDLSELEEAQALNRLVEFYGSQHTAAKRLSMSRPLISQKLSLLLLTPSCRQTWRLADATSPTSGTWPKFPQKNSDRKQIAAPRPTRTRSGSELPSGPRPQPQPLITQLSPRESRLARDPYRLYLGRTRRLSTESCGNI